MICKRCLHLQGEPRHGAQRDGGELVDHIQKKEEIHNGINGGREGGQVTNPDPGGTFLDHKNIRT